jgi:hypothetical protein
VLGLRRTKASTPFAAAKARSMRSCHAIKKPTIDRKARKISAAPSTLRQLGDSRLIAIEKNKAIMEAVSARDVRDSPLSTIIIGASAKKARITTGAAKTTSR